jgi:hypothetical protein
MRKVTFALAFVVLVASGLYAVRIGRAARHPKEVAPAPAAVPPPVAAAASRPLPPPLPYHAPEPGTRAAPGTYLPRGFSPEFRERIVKDFGEQIDHRLGASATAEQRTAAAAVQNAFWDVHGPNVDLFREHKISQPEFAERTHLAMIKFADGMANIFTDAQYVKMFDMPKGVDPYYAMFHSAEEQPGLPMKSGMAQNRTVTPQPASNRPVPASTPDHVK